MHMLCFAGAAEIKNNDRKRKRNQRNLLKISVDGQPLPKKVVNGKEVQVDDFDKKGTPGAKRTFTCKWHPFAQARDGLAGIVNRDEIGKAHLETTYEDNIVKAEIPVELVNLKVTDITLDPNPSAPGQAANGTTTVQNDSEKAFIATNTVWRVRHSTARF